MNRRSVRLRLEYFQKCKIGRNLLTLFYLYPDVNFENAGIRFLYFNTSVSHSVICLITEKWVGVYYNTIISKCSLCTPISSNWERGKRIMLKHKLQRICLQIVKRDKIFSIIFLFKISGFVDNVKIYISENNLKIWIIFQDFGNIISPNTKFDSI